MQWVRNINWGQIRLDSMTLLTKLLRSKDLISVELDSTTTQSRRLTRCLTTLDLTSLSVGSCVGTGMYLVAGMVARKYAGPAVIISFIFAAFASLFSGVSYAEFGVRVPNTTGSAYTYSYVTVGEFLAFIIGWNMILEYLIGTSACARALSACLDTMFDGSLSEKVESTFGTVFGRPPDVVAFVITLLMTVLLLAGVKKSLVVNNILNGINLSVWVFIMAAGLFYIDLTNWTNHGGFFPFGWDGVFSGAATCFYAFIGFDIIATTGEEAQNPKRSIPFAIVYSLGIILVAYMSSSLIITLMVPFDRLEVDSALVEVFGQVYAPTCKYIVSIGAMSGLTASMFGSMFPMPRIIYAMAKDGLIFKPLGVINEETGIPARATVLGGVAAATVALFVRLEVLVEMMSIGTLLAYTLVSVCVLVLRYQPSTTSSIELLPHRLITTDQQDSGTRDNNMFGMFGDGRNPKPSILPASQRVVLRRMKRSSPDSDDTMQNDDSEEFGRDDSFLVSDQVENNYYGTVPSGCAYGTRPRCAGFYEGIGRRLQSLAYYLCPALFPWVDLGPATHLSGMYVIKAVFMLILWVILFDMFATYTYPSESTFTLVVMIFLLVGIVVTLLAISTKPQNCAGLIYTTPGLPFVPGIAIMSNIYLIFNLSSLTLVRFVIWMSIGLVVYFKYGIKNSLLENVPVAPPTPMPTPNVLDRTTIPPKPPRPERTGDRNIFEGDDGDNQGLYSNDQYDPMTNTTTTTATKLSRPPWAEPDPLELGTK